MFSLFEFGLKGSCTHTTGAFVKDSKEMGCWRGVWKVLEVKEIERRTGAGDAGVTLKQEGKFAWKWCGIFTSNYNIILSICQY